MPDLPNGSKRILTLAPVLIAGWTLTFAAFHAHAQSAGASPTEHAEITVSEKVLDGYAGRYQLGSNLNITMTREGNHLNAQASGQNRFELFPETEKEFFAKIAPIRVTFVTDDQKKAIAIVVHQGGKDTSALRTLKFTAEDLKGKCEQIDSMAAEEFGKHPTGSLTVAVVLGKELIWTRSYGYADMERHVLADKDTIYRIGSITKMFTAVMLEQLVEASKVHFTDPVDKYFPEIDTVQGKFSWSPPVTFFELATHTSGMGREPDNTDEYVKGPAADWVKTLIAALPHAHFIFEPGTHYFYSNIGYATLGAALSRVAGEPYLEYVPKHIFMPLGMAHTSLVLTPDMEPHLSQGYDAQPGQVDSQTALNENKGGRGYKVPNGAVYTTVGDLSRFASFLMGDGPDIVLSKKALDNDLTRSSIQADFSLTSGYGFGVSVMHRDTYTAFGHGGTVAGYQAALYMNRETGVGVILLENALGPGVVDTHALALKALDMLSK